MVNELKNQIEALLFACGRKMTLDELKLHLPAPTAALKEATAELQKEYTDRESPVMIVQEGDSWKLTTREKYLSIVRKINPNTERKGPNGREKRRKRFFRGSAPRTRRKDCNFRSRRR